MRRRQAANESVPAILACVPLIPVVVSPGVWGSGATMLVHYGPLLMLTVTFAVYEPAAVLAGTVSWKSGV